MVNMKTIYVCLLGALLASTSVSVAMADAEVAPVASAQVAEIKGPVARVNKGEGMTLAVAGDALKSGDEVFAGKDSSVSLYFASAQCSFIVPASTVYRVTDKAPCVDRTANIVPTADVPSDPGVAPVAAAGIAPIVLLGAGAVVAGGVAVAIIVTNDDNNNSNSPASPD